VKVTWDPTNKVMRTESNPAEGSAAKKSIVERKILPDGQLLMVTTIFDLNNASFKVKVLAKFKTYSIVKLEDA